jgi:hypothetical protein
LFADLVARTNQLDMFYRTLETYPRDVLHMQSSYAKFCISSWYEVFTVSELTEGPPFLAEDPSPLKPDSLHLSRALYNSTEGSSILAKSLSNYKSEVESQQSIR